MPWKKVSCQEAQSRLHFLKGAFQIFELELQQFAETGVSEQVDSYKKKVEGYSDWVHDGLPDIELSVKKAKEIMGEDFYGAERYLEVFGQELYLDELGRVPFTVSELRKAKERGMRLIARYDLQTVPEPSVAFSKMQDLGINLPSEHQNELTKSVENGWVLVGEPSMPVNLFLNPQFSWDRAVKFLGEDPDPDAHEEVERVTDWTHEALRVGDVLNANGLIKDLMANKFSKGGHFLVKANEAIYDALMVSKGDPKTMQQMLGPAITGTFTQSGDDWKFLRLDYFYGTGQGFDFTDIKVTAHDLLETLQDGMRYQIRV